ncbi:ABC-2 type transport system ATP-binding protein [Solimonas aquatica]|uniref:ABC-2 type transport system ATP-binding protein n=1 Tax=Solimonas aquatica TaxID=489703 RepID=A0A1H9EME1_9GAMM|nr:ABC transporter ATP-binding protein [Solimonas aquatica]SEQ26884.1 ABC-2 type transport system ATP-binding protein [Solimonas aquatica]
MASEVLIQARGLTRRYGPTVAVENLDLTLRQGEILGLLGPNGAGKSTTMKMLTGNLAPSGGEIEIKGISLRENPKAAKRHLGYLPEQPPVYPELTVDEYLRFCAGLHGLPAGEIGAALDSAKRDCGLTEVGGRLIGNLSKGYQQRVGIAQAILHRPPVVILDEPTVGLDPIQIREIRTLIAELGKTYSVIVSSHILPEIQAVCGRVMIIARGRVVYHENLSALQDQAAQIIAEFRRTPDIAELGAVLGVAAVEGMGENRYRFTPTTEVDPRESIVEASVRNGWGLIELHAQNRSLEEIFVELTSADLRSAA